MVAFCAVTAMLVPGVTMMSTFMFTNSEARTGRRSRFPIVWPIVNRDVVPLHPIQFAGDPRRKASTPAGGASPRIPIAVNFIDRLRVHCGAERKHHRTQREPENDG